MKQEIITVALADDHTLVMNLLASYLNNNGGFKVLFTAIDGAVVIQQIQRGLKPDVLLLDLSMPVIDGHETAVWMKDNYPEVGIIMLTQYDSETTQIRLLHAGVKGFLPKDVHPYDLSDAIRQVKRQGYYYKNLKSRTVNLVQNNPEHPAITKNLFDDTEFEFLQLASTDLTYDQIAAKMKLDKWHMDKLRDTLFEKFGVTTRTGMAMMAVRAGLIGLKVE